MLIAFFEALRAARLPVSVGEFLALLEALRAGVAGPGIDGCGEALATEDFYHLARTVLVKDEKHYDRFDRVFGLYFQAVQAVAEKLPDIPADWLRRQLARELTPEQRAAIQRLGWDELMATLQQRLAEQKERHEGGSRWIGTGGTSPFGNGGHHPEGVRIGGDGGGRGAVQVWEQRTFRDYDDSQELGIRNLQVALRRLRRFARQGAADQFDLDGTVASTAANAGWLDIRMRPERRNTVRLLLLMDVGGSMDEHVGRVEALFSAVRSEFRQLEFFYFHNCVYDFVWKHNQRRHAERIDTWDLLRRYGREYRLLLVGDATMSPHEILHPGGSVEYRNEECGAEWLQRLAHHFPHHAWINPEPPGVWGYRQSIGLVQQIMSARMYPLSLKGLEDTMRLLSK